MRNSAPQLERLLAGKADPPQADHLVSGIFGAGNQISPANPGWLRLGGGPRPDGGVAEVEG